MKNLSDVKELFQNTVDRAQAINSEMKRLYSIEERFTDLLSSVNGEIKGIEKACSFSSINADAQNALKLIIKAKKAKANDYCWRLGIDTLYKD